MKFYRCEKCKEERDFGVLHRGGEWAEQGRVEEEESKKAAGAEGVKAPAMCLRDWLCRVIELSLSLSLSVVLLG